MPVINRMTPAGIRALGELANGPMSGTELLIRVGFHWKQTLRVLESRGLVQGQRRGYRLTPEGRAAVKDLLETGDLTTAPEVN